ncbi:hypothetical protein BG011_004777 [Mortierella polycephala]|uniref:Uncharacterized protein n=1 Tax=Mortierella polycephala TaxID=41804 RepID=A0A9P6U9T2_9FUNG|nr:hypothetical protein BG011_004777 [Mortierella polycephala]
MTDHITAKLATSLHVSPSTSNVRHGSATYQTGLENSRGFHRIQPVTDGSTSTPAHPIGSHPIPQDPSGISSSEPRKYRKAVGTRSNPTTPVSSHPPSPGPFFHSTTDDPFSSSSSTSNPFLGSSPTSGKLFESFARNTTSSTIFLDPKQSARSSNLLQRRETRANQHQHTKAPAQHPLAMATRLALFHRILTTTKSVPAQTMDKDVWIAKQASKRGFPDRPSFEAALASHTQVLVAALASLGGGCTQMLHQRQSSSYTSGQSPDQEIAIYITIQTTVDAILENAQWLCGPDFEMGINRICPQWSIHEGSIEQIVHYVQVVESMRETLSGRFQHPQDLNEDLARSQEVIDYQRTLFGETLRNHGLDWRVLGLPPMEGLIHGTQDWILNLAKVLTLKIRAEVTFALESTSHRRTTAGAFEAEMEESELMGQSVSDAMDMILQGALLTGSCLELSGKRYPMLVTAWMDLASQYCACALAKRKEHVLKASRVSTRALRKYANQDLQPGLGRSDTRKQQQQYQAHAGMNRGVFLKTMEVFENVSRLLQCVMEMREQECRDEGLGISADHFRDQESSVNNNSGGSSDQDEAMDYMSTASSSVVSLQQPDSGLDQQNQYFQQPSTTSSVSSSHQHYRPLPRSSLHHAQRRLPVDPTGLQRWISTESLASVLVDTGLELCGSMAEILGSGNYSTSASPTVNPSFKLPMSMPPSSSFSYEADFNYSPFGTTSLDALHQSLELRSAPASAHFTPMSSATRAAAAITSLTAFAGGGAMASGTGGVGLIYVQFVVRLLTKMIEFAGQDSHQEQRLLRIHSSLQNLELALSAS